MQEREREKELELIKKQYLGTEKVKKKIRKPSEKFHLNFDWEVTDDTSKDLNPIYNQTHEAALLFGSGKRAGVDVQEQKKLAAEHQRQLLKKMRQAQVDIIPRHDGFRCIYVHILAPINRRRVT